MNIGVLKELSPDEHMVALTPLGAATLIKHGHNVFVATGCGEHADASDEAYQAAGAIVMENAREVSENVDILTKVQPPLPEEFNVFREVQTLFSYIHSETRLPLIEMLLEKRITGIAMENIQDNDGRFPIIEPMTRITGQHSIFMASQHLLSTNGGNGVSILRIPGQQPATIIVLGANIAGEAAARSAASYGANVILADNNNERIQQLAPLLPTNITLRHAETFDLEQQLPTTDVIINSIPASPDTDTPSLTRNMLHLMKRGAVIIDIAPRLGNVESISQPTSHNEPAFEEEGVIHLAIPNIPSAVAATASRALETAHLPWLLELANTGVIRALKANGPMRCGLTSFNGTLCWSGAAEKQGLPWKHPDDVLSISST